MEHYAGIDVSLESASICVVDASGQIVREAKVASEPEVLIGWFDGLGIAVARIGLEAGPLSQWLYAGMRDVGLPVELLETRHVRAAFKATPPRTFPNRIRELVAGHATLSTIAEALLAARGPLFEQCQKLEKRLRSLARQDQRVRLLMTAPGVGPIVGLTYASAIDDPGRFKSSKAVGAHFGLTPKKYQSGETDVTGRISKIGDGGVRTALYEAANVILTRPVKGSTLKSWGMRLAARAGMRKAKVALARKLAVVSAPYAGHGTTFLADKAAPAAAH
jgi:transposase